MVEKGKYYLCVKKFRLSDPNKPEEAIKDYYNEYPIGTTVTYRWYISNLCYDYGMMHYNPCFIPGTIYHSDKDGELTDSNGHNVSICDYNDDVFSLVEFNIDQKVKDRLDMFYKKGIHGNVFPTVIEVKGLVPVLVTALKDDYELDVNSIELGYHVTLVTIQPAYRFYAYGGADGSTQEEALNKAWRNLRSNTPITNAIRCALKYRRSCINYGLGNSYYNTL